jgi:hypothetical protein
MPGLLVLCPGPRSPQLTGMRSGAGPGVRARRSTTDNHFKYLLRYSMMSMPEAAAEMLAGAAEAIESTWGFDSENTRLLNLQRLHLRWT